MCFFYRKKHLNKQRTDWWCMGLYQNPVFPIVVYVNIWMAITFTFSSKSYVYKTNQTESATKITKGTKLWLNEK